MPSQFLIFQEMNEDYVDGVLESEIVEFVTTCPERANAQGMYSASIFVGAVSTESVALHLVHKAGTGYFVSICDQSQPETAPTDWVLLRQAMPSGKLADEPRIGFKTARWSLNIPEPCIVQESQAIAAIRHFARTATMHPELPWIRYEELGVDLYA